MDTIFALATAPGRAGVAVIRLSGELAYAAAQRVAGSLPLPGRSVRTLRDASGEVIDEALVLTFAKGHSFTGEAVVEFQVHGSPAVVRACLATLRMMPGLRDAEHGEFTRRALANGRLDLAQVEGLADLIDAETEVQRQLALRVMTGRLSELAAAWRADLLRAAALIETGIDFADEDVPLDLEDEVIVMLGRLRQSLAREAAGVGAAERVRAGFEVAIVGAPNVGKSTLLNALAGREAALTSARAGTTRDVIEVRMEIAGLPVTLLDTAGVRETADELEQAGIARALERASAADVRVHLVESGSSPVMDVVSGDIVVVAKADLNPDGSNAVSGLTGFGLDRLVTQIGERLSGRVGAVGVASRDRHRMALTRAAQSLDLAMQEVAGHGAVELVAEHVRAAIRAVDSLVGRIDVEDVLGEIFARFCIGK